MTATDDHHTGLSTVASSTFRHVAGHLASGVTVVTTRSAGVGHGMTASAVTSLSLDPPMMVVCLNKAAPTAAAVLESGVYAINVLDQGSVHLAQQFARPSEDKFAGVPLRRGPLGVPLLAQALATMECRVVDHTVGGTHSIVIGEVVDAATREGNPLTYYRGSFGRFVFDEDEATYLLTRERMLHDRGRDGLALDIERLADELGVDAVRLRDALPRLAADGLLRRDDTGRYVVAPFDLRVADETFEARGAIELGVIELALGRVDGAELRRLRASFERMAALLVGNRFVDFDAYLDANYAFHENVVGLARNPSLSAAFGRLGVRTVMARSFGVSPLTSQSFVDVQRTLTEAFEAGNAVAARQAVIAYGALASARARELLLEPTDGERAGE